MATARADEPAFTDDPVVRGALPPELQALLLEADRFEVLMIACERGAAPDEEALGSYPIIRRVELTPGEDRARLLSRIYQGIAEADQLVRTGCFEPHHAVRARKGAQLIDLVICFKCSSMLIAHPERGGGAQITAAARPELERLLGPVEDRTFAGRTLAGWCRRLRELGRRGEGARDALGPDDMAGIRVLVDALGWAGHLAAPGCVRALRALGPAAAPATPALREYLGREPLDPVVARWALEVVETIGAPAADLVPTIVERLRDIVERRVPDAPRLGDDPDDLARAAIRALGGIGPPAHAAAPLLERLAADPGRQSALREDAERAALRITKG